MSAWLAGAACFAVVVALQLLVVRRAGSGARGASRVNVRRRAQHALTGLLVAALAEWTGEGSRAFDVAVLAASCLFLYAAHRARLVVPAFRRWVEREFGPILREHELTQLPGAFYFLLGCLVCAAAFEKRVTVAAILCLGLADPAAAVVGTLFGRRRVGRAGKTVEGCAAAAAAGSAAVMAYSCTFAAPSARSAAWALGAGAAAAASEALCPPAVDDNVAIPVAVGAFLTLAVNVPT